MMHHMIQRIAPLATILLSLWISIIPINITLIAIMLSSMPIMIIYCWLSVMPKRLSLLTLFILGCYYDSIQFYPFGLHALLFLLLALSISLERSYTNDGNLPSKWLIFTGNISMMMVMQQGLCYLVDGSGNVQTALYAVLINVLLFPLYYKAIGWIQAPRIANVKSYHG